jgi:hypothetical protein
MGYTIKLVLDLKFTTNIPQILIDFLVNRYIYAEVNDFRWIHGEDSKENSNILTFKHQYQYTQHEVDIYQYVLAAHLYFKDDE